MKVLFVCAGNAFRSPLAEALLKKLRGDLEVDSAGIHPASRIAWETKRFLDRESALKNVKPRPEGIESKNLEEYDLIVVMENWQRQAIIRLNPKVQDRIRVWNIPDPYYLPPEETDKVFETIKLKVEELAEEI
ncbi:low molecular weight phosphatase family protein [Candidatus Bathyarchaeota archaeon]|nr:low molecular weight phosphatase family protein [Candidatus Bathyarchaeota archaeon]